MILVNDPDSDGLLLGFSPIQVNAPLGMLQTAQHLSIDQ